VLRDPIVEHKNMSIRKIYLKNHYSKGDFAFEGVVQQINRKTVQAPSNLENTEPFYQVYVNGEPTDYRVNSTGTGLSAFLPVDPSKR
jgi:hypothetical protein